MIEFGERAKGVARASTLVDSIGNVPEGVDRPEASSDSLLRSFGNGVISLLRPLPLAALYALLASLQVRGV